MDNLYSQGEISVPVVHGISECSLDIVHYFSFFLIFAPNDNHDLVLHSRFVVKVSRSHQAKVANNSYESSFSVDLPPGAGQPPPAAA